MRVLNITCNASGAAEAGKRGDVVVIVDVIDMSTTAESFIDVGISEIFGASSDGAKVPVRVDPELIGYRAGSLAVQKGTNVILVSEPRTGDDEARISSASLAIRGVLSSGAKICAVLPNIGWETPKMIDVKGEVLLCTTASGGSSFDAAYINGASAVITGTVARSIGKKGDEPARASALRAIELATRLGANITVVAASSNSIEDILAAEFIGKIIVSEGFLLI